MQAWFDHVRRELDRGSAPVHVGGGESWKWHSGVAYAKKRSIHEWCVRYSPQAKASEHIASLKPVKSTKKQQQQVLLPEKSLIRRLLQVEELRRVIFYAIQHDKASLYFRGHKVELEPFLTWIQQQVQVEHAVLLKSILACLSFEGFVQQVLPTRHWKIEMASGTRSTIRSVDIQDTWHTTIFPVIFKAFVQCLPLQERKEIAESSRKNAPSPATPPKSLLSPRRRPVHTPNYSVDSYYESKGIPKDTRSSRGSHSVSSSATKNKKRWHSSVSSPSSRPSSSRKKNRTSNVVAPTLLDFTSTANEWNVEDEDKYFDSLSNTQQKSPFSSSPTRKKADKPTTKEHDGEEDDNMSFEQQELSSTPPVSPQHIPRVRVKKRKKQSLSRKPTEEPTLQDVSTPVGREKTMKSPSITTASPRTSSRTRTGKLSKKTDDSPMEDVSHTRAKEKKNPFLLPVPQPSTTESPRPRSSARVKAKEDPSKEDAPVTRGKDKEKQSRSLAPVRPISTPTSSRVKTKKTTQDKEFQTKEDVSFSTEKGKHGEDAPGRAATAQKKEPPSPPIREPKRSKKESQELQAPRTRSRVHHRAETPGAPAAPEQPPSFAASSSDTKRKPRIQAGDKTPDDGPSSDRPKSSSTSEKEKSQGSVSITTSAPSQRVEKPSATNSAKAIAAVPQIKHDLLSPEQSPAEKSRIHPNRVEKLSFLGHISDYHGLSRKYPTAFVSLPNRSTAVELLSSMDRALAMYRKDLSEMNSKKGDGDDSDEEMMEIPAGLFALSGRRPRPPTRVDPETELLSTQHLPIVFDDTDSTESANIPRYHDEEIPIPPVEYGELDLEVEVQERILELAGESARRSDQLRAMKRAGYEVLQSMRASVAFIAEYNGELASQSEEKALSEAPRDTRSRRAFKLDTSRSRATYARLMRLFGSAHVDHAKMSISQMMEKLDLAIDSMPEVDDESTDDEEAAENPKKWAAHLRTFNRFADQERLARMREEEAAMTIPRETRKPTPMEKEVAAFAKRPIVFSSQICTNTNGAACKFGAQCSLCHVVRDPTIDRRKLLCPPFRRESLDDGVLDLRGEMMRLRTSLAFVQQYNAEQEAMVVANEERN